MKRILLFLPVLLLLPVISDAQGPSRSEADSMIMVLNKTKQGAYRMELLLNLAQFHLYKPGQYKTDLDSAAVYIEEAKVLSKPINNPDADGYLLLTESSLIKERGEKALSSVFTSAEGKKMAERSIEILQAATKKDHLGKAYYELSSYYDYFDSLQAMKKINLLQQAVNVFQQAGDLKWKGICLETLADLYYIWVSEDKSIQALNEALAIFNSINYKKLQGIYVLFGRIYYHRYDYATALSALLKALKAARTTQDTSLKLCQIDNYIGNIYFDIDRLDMSVRYFEDALQIARKYEDNDAVFFVTGGLSMTYINLGQWDRSLKVLDDLPKNSRLFEDPAEKTVVYTCYLRSYLGLQQLGKARPYCDSIINITDNKLANRVFNRKAMNYMYAANFYFLSNQYAKTRYYLAKSDTIAKQTNDDYVQVHNLELLYKLDSALGNVQAAFKHLLQFKHKTDSVSGVKKARQFQIMNVEYEVAMKEDSIKLKDRDISLLTQRNNLQQANLKQARLIKNITGGGVILSFIIIGLLYRQYRQKQKSNRLITQKNAQLQHLLTEKDWLVKEIHHRVKNNFQTVMGLLGSQSAYLKTGEAINAINESQQRIQAMSLIHQRLYQSNNLSAIHMTDYIHELTSSLNESFNTNYHVLFDFNIEPIELDLAHCIPLGLILNEAITNSFKYAFTDNQAGIISISLKRSSINNFLLTIKDNGIGLPSGFKVNESSTMGMNLMKGLSAEIAANFSISNKNGTQITVSFAYVLDVAKEITLRETEPISMS